MGSEMPFASEPLGLEVEGAFLLQKREIAEDVLFDLTRFGFGIEQLQLADNLRHGMLAVAARNDFEAWTIQAQGPFGHEQDALIVVFTHAASRGEARPAVQIEAHRLSSAGWKAPGGGQPGFT